MDHLLRIVGAILLPTLLVLMLHPKAREIASKQRRNSASNANRWPRHNWAKYAQIAIAILGVIGIAAAVLGW